MLFLRNLIRGQRRKRRRRNRERVRLRMRAEEYFVAIGWESATKSSEQALTREAVNQSSEWVRGTLRFISVGI